MKLEPIQVTRLGKANREVGSHETFHNVLLVADKFPKYQQLCLGLNRTGTRMTIFGFNVRLMLESTGTILADLWVNFDLVIGCIILSHLNILKVVLGSLQTICLDLCLMRAAGTRRGGVVHSEQLGCCTLPYTEWLL